MSRSSGANSRSRTGVVAGCDLFAGRTMCAEVWPTRLAVDPCRDRDSAARIDSGSYRIFTCSFAALTHAIFVGRVRRQPLVPEDDRVRMTEQGAQCVGEPHGPFADRARLVALAAVHVERQAADHGVGLFGTHDVGDLLEILAAAGALNDRETGRAASCSGSQTATPMRDRLTSSARSLPDGGRPVCNYRLASSIAAAIGRSIRRSVRRRAIAASSVHNTHLDAVGKSGQHGQPVGVLVDLGPALQRPACGDGCGGLFFRESGRDLLELDRVDGHDVVGCRPSW